MVCLTLIQTLATGIAEPGLARATRQTKAGLATLVKRRLGGADGVKETFQRFGAGNETAKEALWAAVRASLVQLALRRTGDRAQAEDAAHDTLVYLLERAHLLSSPRDLRILHNKFRHSPVEPVSRPLVDEDLASRQDSRPAEALIHVELNRDLNQLIDALPEAQRRMVDQELAGVARKDIADELGISKAAVSIAVIKTVEILRTQLLTLHRRELAQELSTGLWFSRTPDSKQPINFDARLPNRQLLNLLPDFMRRRPEFASDVVAFLEVRGYHPEDVKRVQRKRGSPRRERLLNELSSIPALAAMVESESRRYPIIDEREVPGFPLRMLTPARPVYIAQIVADKRLVPAAVELPAGTSLQVLLYQTDTGPFILQPAHYLGDRELFNPAWEQPFLHLLRVHAQGLKGVKVHGAVHLSFYRPPLRPALVLTAPAYSGRELLKWLHQPRPEWESRKLPSPRSDSGG